VGADLLCYVVGFFFDSLEAPAKVALIRKNHPPWQQGLLNGIGGHVKNDETPLEAMRREFKEEAGCYCSEWEYALLLNAPGILLYVFRASGSVDLLHSMTDELIEVCDLDGAWDVQCVTNLRWIIPLLLDDTISLPLRIDCSKLPGDDAQKSSLRPDDKGGVE